MPYQCSLGSGQYIYLDNPGNQTLITVASHGVGQQQQASSSLSTGPWTALPQVVQINGGAIIRCVTAQGTFTFQVQGMQVSTATDSSVNWQAAHQINLQVVDAVPGQTMPPMSPMSPMKPMQMGNMQMSANPMAMRMGNMEMQMGRDAIQSARPRSFCTQCGAPVGPEDRFCGSCGHKLKD